MPEVSFEETRIVVQNILTEPDVDSCFAIIASERINAILLGPEINHLASRHSEGISEHSSKICAECSTEKDNGKDRHTAHSPHD